MLPDNVHELAAPESPRRDRRIIGLAAFAGLLLGIIGIRFFFVPDDASRTFGLLGRPNGYQLHAVVALRDVWLGVLAVGLAWFEEWRGLTLWLALGALVCFGDAGIVVAAEGKLLSVLFHFVSGIFCGVLAALCWRRALRRGR
jgi:hypothetical protein